MFCITASEKSFLGTSFLLLIVSCLLDIRKTWAQKFAMERDYRLDARRIDFHGSSNEKFGLLG